MEEQQAPPNSSPGRKLSRGAPTKSKRYPPEVKQAILKAYVSWKGSQETFCKSKGISVATLWNWEKTAKTRVKRKIPSPDERRTAVEKFLKSKMRPEHFSKIWGVHPKALMRWVKAYEEGGPQGLEGKVGRKRGKKPIDPVLRKHIIAVKKEYPFYGTRKVAAFLARFSGLKVSTPMIRTIVAEENLPSEPAKARRWEKVPLVRTFERAKPGEMWQSDITSFLLTRHSLRVYLVVFMDDHSRYVVAWKLAVRQTGDFVQECLLEGVQKFGRPIEVLTDQGRQYFAWHGKSQFQYLLHKLGIKHVVSRAHHPETLGKCERFWETVGNEFWSRACPQELSEAQEKIGHFIKHYNHFRPHQGIGNATPADRFFGVEAQVRDAIEGNMGKNQLALALQEQPRQPVFLVGQIGDQAISLHGEKGKLVLQTQDGKRQEVAFENFGTAPAVPLTSENNHDADTGTDPRTDSGSIPDSPQAQEGPQGGQEEDGISYGHTPIPGAILVGSGQPGGTAEGSPDGSLDAGTLAGQDDPQGAGREVEPPTAESLADEPAGTGRDGGGASETAQEPAQGNDPALGGRAEGESHGLEEGEREAEAGERASDGVGGGLEGHAGEQGTGLGSDQVQEPKKNQSQSSGEFTSESGSSIEKLGEVTLDSSQDI